MFTTAVLAYIGGHVGSIVARILTGICGGVIVAVINRQTATLQGPDLWWLLAGVFAVVFVIVTFLEKWLARKPVQLIAPEQDQLPVSMPVQDQLQVPVPEQDVGSYNHADGTQEIDIGGKAAARNVGLVGSRNTTKSDQKIKIR